MIGHPPLSRRSFLAAATTPLALGAKSIPVGIELYSLRDLMKDDLMGTVRAVAEMGYEGVEFYSPYYDWTVPYAKEVKQILDQLQIRCFSTHNGYQAFAPENFERTVELNRILGCGYVVMASAGKAAGIDGRKRVAEVLNKAADRFQRDSLRAGFHNHLSEWKPVEGTRPMDVLATNTGKDVVLQLDVGPCVEGGSDPVEWIKANPGRIASLHVKDWAAGSPKEEKAYRVLLGEGVVPWKQVFEAAEQTGGVRYYLIEQEGSRFSSMETAKRCLQSFRKLHGA
jgi:sugar phosphate isomerase/epimerase